MELEQILQDICARAEAERPVIMQPPAVTEQGTQTDKPDLTDHGTQTLKRAPNPTPRKRKGINL